MTDIQKMMLWNIIYFIRLLQFEIVENVINNSKLDHIECTHWMNILIRDLFSPVPIDDSKRFYVDYISSDNALILDKDYSSSVVLPEERLTDWIKVSVRATFAVLPSQTSCHDSVLFNKPKASPCLPSFDWHVAILR
jgi:hypothetical protein